MMTEEQLQKKLKDVSSYEMVKIGTAMAILEAGANNNLDPGHKADIAKVWLNLHYNAALLGIMKLIMSKIMKDKLDLDQVKALLADIGIIALGECEELSRRAITMTELLREEKPKPENKST